MRFLLISTTLGALALSSMAQAWKLDIFEHEHFEGDKNSYSGPGRKGWACHSVGDLNGETGRISSLKYWNDAVGSRCCLELYDSPGCGGKKFSGWGGCHDYNYPDLGEIRDDISSFATNCK
ncbi:uncharacterized protein BJX67DRAFT_383434 [Aspergillus lucknowensis]|uniref:Uncharacterized protein n=1 Tax=Aspergillus lucknowensis TaxID=176173 RepID=A0ABR4LK04_9EURO